MEKQTGDTGDFDKLMDDKNNKWSQIKVWEFVIWVERIDSKKKLQRIYI